MAAELPVVATAVGGIPELVRPGVTGELVSSGDAEALADRIIELLTATRAAGSVDGVAGEIFNVGGGSRIALRDTLALIEELAGRQLDIRYGPPCSGDVKDTGADTAQARDKLAYSPAVSFENGLRAEFEWMLAATAQPA
jgi:nucleoside-diphosphate-sugar epimerase